jgi:hypothetical protein
MVAAGGRWEGDLDAEPASGAGAGGDGGAVGGGDGLDSGQAKAVAVVVGAAGVEALERLEEPVDFAARDERSGVRHR